MFISRVSRALPCSLFAAKPPNDLDGRWVQVLGKKVLRAGQKEAEHTPHVYSRASTN